MPQRPLDIESAALELVALEALRADPDFIASDPMVATELDELQSVAFEQLAQLLRPLLNPRGPASDWMAEGKRLEVTGDRPGTMAVSDLLNARYPLTPKIGNEQLMRDQVSRTMQTARVRVISGILERSERPRLGLDDGDRSAEGSVYRTVLEKTGLHRNEDRRFALLHEVAEPGLAKAWSVIAAFFQTPTSDGGRPLSDLTDQLKGSPMGVPAGVLPMLVAAGYKQFARTVGIYRKGLYESDLLGFQFDQMVVDPTDISVRVVAADIRVCEYLRELCYAFQHEYPAATDELVRRAYDEVRGWLLTVPDAARRTQKLDDSAKKLLQAISTATDPLRLLLSAIPAAFGAAGPDRGVVGRVEHARKAIDELRDMFADEAVTTVSEAFRIGTTEAGDLLEAVTTWAACFDADDMLRREDLRISDKAILSRAVPVDGPREMANPWRLSIFQHGGNYLQLQDALVQGAGDRAENLPGLLRCYFGCAAFLSGEPDGRFVLRIDPARRRVVMWPLIDPDSALPRSEISIRVDLKRQDVHVRADARRLLRKGELQGVGRRRSSAVPKPCIGPNRRCPTTPSSNGSTLRLTNARVPTDRWRVSALGTARMAWAA